MQKLDMLKTVTGAVVSVGVGAVVGNAIKSTTPTDMTTVTKVAVGVGAFVLTTLAREAATKKANEIFDETAESIKTAYQAVRNQN